MCIRDRSDDDDDDADEDAGSRSASPLTLDLPDCFDVPSRVEEGSRLLNSARYRRLVHPLDRGMLLSFAVSVIYLAAALAAVCPTVVLVCVVLPLAVAARRVAAWCCGGGTPIEAYDDFGVRMFDATPLSGHEEFWVTPVRRRGPRRELVWIGMSTSRRRQLTDPHHRRAMAKDGQPDFDEDSDGDRSGTASGSPRQRSTNVAVNDVRAQRTSHATNGDVERTR